MAKKRPDEEAFIRFGELQVPVSLYFEQRRNTRISIGSETIHLRLPRKLSRDEYRDQITWAKKWLHRRFEKAPALLERFKSIYFRNGDRIKVLNDVYVLHIEASQRKSVKATLDQHDIFIALSADMPVGERNKSILSILHKLMCQRYQSDLSDRVETLNERHFQATYFDVAIKHIQSKWGSCSSDGNIVLSSKLLLCPKWVRDYVIIHELAHLLELNHSPRFWALVESAMPDYKKADKWLDEIGAGLDIRPMNQVLVTKTIDGISLPETDDVEGPPLPKMTKSPPLPETITPDIPIPAAKESIPEPPKDTKNPTSPSGEQLSLF